MASVSKHSLISIPAELVSKEMQDRLNALKESLGIVDQLDADLTMDCEDCVL